MPVEERREQLRSAALRLIGEQGYQGLTVEAIAAAAGVTKPVLYSAYPTVAALLKDLLDRTQNDALSQLLAAVTGPSMLPSQMTRAWLTIVREHPNTWAPILRIGPGTPDAVLQRIGQGRDTVTAALAQALAGAYGSDQMPRHLAAAQAFVAAAEHFGRSFVASPDSVDVDVVGQLFDDLVRGLRPRRD
ncbi:TetR family transcriptional regulator [Nocardioides baekrokdamisoli]|uniref:TetR family transcriptional regulator n=2 Tax=Nocardioides baekrokdamisoli TaxID=1804624 RepID=A0A3G9IUL1_9ACTN|nr:TetR family transcriptional regulator [Nocardioides baekrokdamisoli]